MQATVFSDLALLSELQCLHLSSTVASTSHGLLCTTTLAAKLRARVRGCWEGKSNWEEMFTWLTTRSAKATVELAGSGGSLNQNPWDLCTCSTPKHSDSIYSLPTRMFHIDSFYFLINKHVDSFYILAMPPLSSSANKPIQFSFFFTSKYNFVEGKIYFHSMCLDKILFLEYVQYL